MADMLIDVKLERVAEGVEDPLQLLATPGQASAQPRALDVYHGLRRKCFCTDPAARATFARLLVWITEQQQQQREQGWAQAQHGHQGGGPLQESPYETSLADGAQTYVRVLPPSVFSR